MPTFGFSWPAAKTSNENTLFAEMTAAGVILSSLSLNGKRTILSVTAASAPSSSTVNAVIAAHSGDVRAEQAAASATASNNETRMRAAAVNAAISSLEAGTATNAQIQNVLAKVLRYLRRENVS